VRVFFLNQRAPNRTEDLGFTLDASGKTTVLLPRMREKA